MEDMRGMVICRNRIEGEGNPGKVVQLLSPSREVYVYVAYPDNAPNSRKRSANTAIVRGNIDNYDQYWRVKWLQRDQKLE